MEGRTFQFSFPLPGKIQHSPKPGKKAKTPGKTGKKKAKPNKDNTVKPDQPQTPKLDQTEYERTRRQKLERKEYKRLYEAKLKSEAKIDGRCTRCKREPALKGQTKCQKCRDKHIAESRKARLNPAV